MSESWADETENNILDCIISSAENAEKPTDENGEDPTSEDEGSTYTVDDGIDDDKDEPREEQPKHRSRNIISRSNVEDMALAALRIAVENKLVVSFTPLNRGTSSMLEVLKKAGKLFIRKTEKGHIPDCILDISKECPNGKFYSMYSFMVKVGRNNGMVSAEECLFRLPDESPTQHKSVISCVYNTHLYVINNSHDRYTFLPPGRQYVMCYNQYYECMGLMLVDISHVKNQGIIFSNQFTILPLPITHTQGLVDSFIYREVPGFEVAKKFKKLPVYIFVSDTNENSFKDHRFACVIHDNRIQVINRKKDPNHTIHPTKYLIYEAPKEKVNYDECDPMDLQGAGYAVFANKCVGLSINQHGNYMLYY